MSQWHEEKNWKMNEKIKKMKKMKKWKMKMKWKKWRKKKEEEIMCSDHDLNWNAV